MLDDLVSVKAYVFAARLMAALPAFHIVCGVDGVASGAGKVAHHLRIPRFVSYFPDPLLRLPEFDPVRHLCLKLLEIVAGILTALAAEVHSPPGSALRHRADGPAVKAPLVRAASPALQFLDRLAHAFRQRLESCRVRIRSDENRTCRTKKPAYSSELLVRFPKIVICLFELVHHLRVSPLSWRISISESDPEGSGKQRGMRTPDSINTYRLKPDAL
jgi:hypothetical protein